MPSRLCLLPLSLLLAAPALGETPVVRVPTASEAVDMTFIRIDGGHNFRDVGGYPIGDGRSVRRGVLYRSASLANLTPQGMAQLQRMRIGSIIDLRSTDERRADTNNWLALSGLGYWTRDYSLETSGFASMFGDPRMLSVERVHQAMADGYRSMPKMLAPSYRMLFARLLTGKGATVVNCTAGKDRTGIATALVLTALGVSYEAARADFLISNKAVRPPSPREAASFSALASLPPDVLAALGGVDGRYLDAAFDQIRQDYGSVEAYLEKELGVGRRELAQLRRRMLY